MQGPPCLREIVSLLIGGMHVPVGKDDTLGPARSPDGRRTVMGEDHLVETDIPQVPHNKIIKL